MGFDALTVREYIVFRDASSVFACRKDVSEIAWTFEFADDRLFALKRLGSVGDDVVALEVTGDGRPKRVVWLDPSTGLLRREVFCSIEPAQEGFLVAAGLVFLYGRAPDNCWMLQPIDGVSGRMLTAVSSPPGQGLYASQERLYLNGMSGGIFHSDPENVSWQRVPVGEVTSIDLQHGQLFFFVAPREKGLPWELVWWSADRAVEGGRVKMDVPQALRIAPAETPGLACVFFEALCAWTMDLAGGVCRWSFMPGGSEEINAAVWTPKGFVLAVKPADEPCRLEVRSERTGAIDTLVPTTLNDIQDLYWIEDRLVASAFDGLETFAWEE